MDVGTILGIGGSVGLIVLSIALGSSVRGYYDLPAMLIVVGGTLFTVLASVPWRTLATVPAALRRALFAGLPDRQQLIQRLVELAVIARRDGILSLESHLDEQTPRFVTLGLQLAIDGTETELVERMLWSEMEAMSARHAERRRVFELLAKYAPAYGLVGTLVGLVAMLAHMTDPAMIGSGIAVALLTTLYGTVLANCIFSPLADKLAAVSRDEWQFHELAMQGILAIQAGDNPRVVEQKMNILLPPGERQE